MASITSADALDGLWPDSGKPGNVERATRLEGSIRAFLAISAAVDLSQVEECALLDLSAGQLAQIRVAPARAFQLGGSKLERRVNYAIPILQRMIAAMSS